MGAWHCGQVDLPGTISFHCALRCLVVDLDLRRFGTGMTYLFLCGFVGDWTWNLRRFGTGITHLHFYTAGYRFDLMQVASELV